MDLVPSAEESEIVDSVVRFLTRELSVSHLRDRLRNGTGIESTSWAAAGEIGVFSLGLSAEAGGVGCSVVEEALVFRQMGRHLAPTAFIAAVIAARLAHGAGLSDARDAIAAGTERVAFAIPIEAAEVGAHVRGRFRLFDARDAAWTLVFGNSSELALVPIAAVHAGPLLESIDPASEMCDASIDGDATAIDTGGPTSSANLTGSLLAAAMAVGIAEAVRDTAVTYAGERVQFGRPIGVNQAIKHKCSIMAVDCEAALSQLFFAAVSLRDQRDDAAFQVAAAWRLALDAALENSRHNVQIHGGIGYTWEHDAHLYVTRAHVLASLFGGRRAFQALVLDLAPAPL